MADVCRTYDVDGEPIRVRSGQPLTAEDLRLLAEITAAAQKHLEEHPPPFRSRPRLVPTGHGRLRFIANCPVHGEVGQIRTSRVACWEDARAHDAKHHEEAANA